MNLYFPHDSEKTLQTTAWIAQYLPSVKLHQMVAIFFFADRTHLVRYGRPIVGGHYAATFQGPIPTEAFCELCDSPDISCSNWVITCEWSDRDLLSPSDILVLQDVCDEYGQKTPVEMQEVWENTKAWKRKYKGAPRHLAYEDFFLDVPEKAKDILEMIHENMEIKAEFCGQFSR